MDQQASAVAGWTPYRYGFDNPIRYSDPDGRWEWDEVGNLSAEKGDNAWNLAGFLGTSVDNSMMMLNRNGITANENDILNLKIGDKIDKNSLYIDKACTSGIVINNTREAFSHYLNGNGVAADVGDQSTKELLNTKKFQFKHNKITSQIVKAEGYFSVDMTDLTFHIGNTGVDYQVSGNGKSSSVKYTLFTNTDKNSSIFSDGFWDPDFVDEKCSGFLSDKFGIDPFKGRHKSDELGPNLERLGGTPYTYKTREKTYFFKPVEKE